MVLLPTKYQKVSVYTPKGYVCTLQYVQDFKFYSYNYSGTGAALPLRLRLAYCLAANFKCSEIHILTWITLENFCTLWESWVKLEGPVVGHLSKGFLKYGPPKTITILTFLSSVFWTCMNHMIPLIFPRLLSQAQHWSLLLPTCKWVAQTDFLWLLDHDL